MSSFDGFMINHAASLKGEIRHLNSQLADCEARFAEMLERAERAEAERDRYRDAIKRHGFTSDADIEAFLR